MCVRFLIARSEFGAAAASAATSRAGENRRTDTGVPCFGRGKGWRGYCLLHAHGLALHALPPTTVIRHMHACMRCERSALHFVDSVTLFA